MVDSKHSTFSIVIQCRLLGLHRSGLYFKPCSESEENLKILRLLKGFRVERANQVWAMDITYVPTGKGFMYLRTVIDLHTRFVVNWGLSNTMTADWCRQVAWEAFDKHGCPEIFNTDQSSRFTSDEFTGLLLKREIQISMDGSGRAIDNIFIERLWRSVKYEHIYLYVAEDDVQLYNGLQEYFSFYNNERSHQSLNYKTPAERYR